MPLRRRTAEDDIELLKPGKEAWLERMWLRCETTAVYALSVLSYELQNAG